MARQPHEAGFTLIEMIVVLAILGLVLGLVMIHGPMRSARLSLDAMIRDMASGLRLARAQAIAQNRTITVALGQAGWQVDRAQLHAIPSGIAVAGDAAIAFRPDGGSSGGRIVIQDGALRATIVIDWLTGRVRVVRIAP